MPDRFARARLLVAFAVAFAIGSPLGVAGAQDLGIHVSTDHYIERTSLNNDYGRNIGFGLRFFSDSDELLRGFGGMDILWKGLGKYSEQEVLQMPLQLGMLLGPTDGLARPFGELAYMCLFKIASMECLPVLGIGASLHLSRREGGVDPYIEYQRTTNGMRSTLVVGALFVWD